jgi:hypothetical protein
MFLYGDLCRLFHTYLDCSSLVAICDLSVPPISGLSILAWFEQHKILSGRPTYPKVFGLLIFNHRLPAEIWTRISWLEHICTHGWKHLRAYFVDSV